MNNKNTIDPNDYAQLLLSDKRIKQFIEMLAVKKDAKMTRVYSAISPANMSNQNDFQTDIQNF